MHPGLHVELGGRVDDSRESRFATPCPQIAPKRASADSKSIWIVRSNSQYHGAKGETENPDAGIVEVLKTAKDDAEFAKLFVAWNQVHMLGVGFNMQRFDFVLADA